MTHIRVLVADRCQRSRRVKKDDISRGEPRRLIVVIHQHRFSVGLKHNEIIIHAIQTDILMATPHLDVLVINGGFGSVNQAMSFGIPLVTAGLTFSLATDFPAHLLARPNLRSPKGAAARELSARLYERRPTHLYCEAKEDGQY
jgi:hypothetical protein